jgi:hypothetical protein
MRRLFAFGRLSPKEHFMTAVFRFGLLTSALALVIGCSGTPVPPVDGGTGGGSGGCFEDSDCPDPHLFFCNTTTSQCEPACKTKSDCTAAVRGMYALSYCDSNALGCQCDDGTCIGSLCAADSDCGTTQVCRSGACVAAPTPDMVASCILVPDFAVLAPNQKLKFRVEAFDMANKPVVLSSGITWSATTGMSVQSTTNPGEADYTAAGAAAASTDGPKVTIGTTTCTAKVTVVNGSPANTEVAAIVTDELTGRGILGATVVVTDNTGATIGMAGTTDASGYAKATGLAGTETDVNISAYVADYSYLTIANYNPSTGSRVMSMVLRRNQVDKYGGAKGSFTPTPMTSNVHVGLSGMSIAGAITDLSLAQLLGNTVPTHVKIGSAIDQENVPLPAGVYLGFSDQQIKTAISSQGLAGVCSDETAVNSGSCGTRSNWGLSGDIPLGDLPIDAFAGGVNNIDFGAVLARIIPIFKKFNSAIVRDVEFTLQPTPTKADGSPDFTDAGTSFFANQDLPFLGVPLAFDFVGKIPTLPKFANTYVDGVLLLGGANVPGRGVVPLGLGVAVNQMPQDSVTDKEATLSAPGLATIRMAPTHDGIEGSQYGVLALALSLKSITSSVATSGIFAHPAMNKLSFDPTGATPLELGTSFPAFPEGAKYNFSDVHLNGLDGRTFKIPSPNSDLMTDLTTNTSIVRVTFTDTKQHRWVVLADPKRITTDGFVLPKPPMMAVDRTFTDDMSTGARSDLLVQTVRLADGTTNIAYKSFVEASATNATRQTDFTTAFTFVDYSHPTISWKTPAAPAGTAAKGGTVTVTVSHFTVGADATSDGYVHLTLMGGTGCDMAVDAKADTSMGKGNIDITLPSGCSGTGITATAALVDPSGTALNPVVQAQNTLTIQ